MIAGTFKALLGTAAALALLAACGGNPNPRGYAQPGVTSSLDRSALNAFYYAGADPSFRPRSGGSN